MATKTLTKPITSAKSKKQKLFRIGALFPLTESNDAESFCKAAEAACHLGFEIRALAEGDASAQEVCFELLEKFPRNFSILESTPQNRSLIIENSDVIVFTGSPEAADLSAIIAERKVPIVPTGGGLSDFNAQTESGEAFTFEAGNFWQLIAAMVRASENYKFSYDWNLLKKNLAKFELDQKA